MSSKYILLALTMLLTTGQAKASDDYKQTPEYLALRDSVHRSFNDADSARFFPALTKLQKYVLEQVTCMSTTPSDAMPSSSS